MKRVRIPPDSVWFHTTYMACIIRPPNTLEEESSNDANRDRIALFLVFFTLPPDQLTPRQEFSTFLLAMSRKAYIYRKDPRPLLVEQPSSAQSCDALRLSTLVQDTQTRQRLEEDFTSANAPGKNTVAVTEHHIRIRARLARARPQCHFAMFLKITKDNPLSSWPQL